MNTKKTWIILSFLVVFGLLTVNTTGLADTPPPTSETTGQGTEPLPPPPQVTPEGLSADNSLEVIDCTEAIAQGIEKQVNMRAALIRVQCGLEAPGVTTPEDLQPWPAVADETNNYGMTDVQVNNALADAYPHITQSTTFIAANAHTVIAAYNSSTAAPTNYSGISYSTDGGNTFTEIRPSPFATGHGTNYGSPIALYNSKYGKWFTIWLTAGGDCGTQGLGIWSSINASTWSTSACVHVGSGDDRPSGWVDNNPSSPYYGTMYISWNDFSTPNGNLVVATSTNGGVSWSAPVMVYSASFMRNVQMTGGQDGAAFIVGMDEGGGGVSPRHNYIFRSINGGGTWTPSISMGSTFPAPGDLPCGYFRAVTPIWRYMGWGQPGVGPNGVVHYVYGVGTGGADTGDVYYVRSTDNGNTWSTPLKFNTDATSRTQWLPSLAVTVNGKLMATWYDRRNTSNNDYQRYGRISLDNGATWEPDQAVSDQIIPQPEQPDPNVNSCYAGDYDYASATNQTVYSAWTDGRVQISGHYQQDVYMDKVDFSPNIPVCTTSGESGWAAVTALPIDVYGAGVADDNVFVYAAGGYSFGPGAVDQFVRYSPIANTWTSLTPMPTPAATTAAVYAMGRIYVFGGLDTSSMALNNTRIFNISTNTWSAGAPMPDVRQQMGSGYYNGKIYLVGGYSSDTVDPAHTMNQTWAYDIASNSWSTLAPLPSALGGSGSAVIGNHLYIFGGRNPTYTALNTVYDYNLLTNNWLTRSPMLSAMNAPGSAVLSGKVWVMGGGTPFQSNSQAVPGEYEPEAVMTSNVTQIYDPNSDSWSFGPPQIYPRSFQGATSLQGIIVSVGGYNGDSVPITEITIARPLRILVSFADIPAPGTIQNALLAQPGVALVDLFDARTSTPALDLLKKYDVVVSISNYGFYNSSAMGDVIADYLDVGGVVVVFTFGLSDAAWGIHGRWITGGYTPFNLSTTVHFSTATLGTVEVPNSPLLFGASHLTAYWRNLNTIASGATLIARWSDNDPMIAVKARAVGVTGYIGDSLPMWSGNFARLIINAGFSLHAGSTCGTLLNIPMLKK